jgi:hypothetical protein
MADGIFPSLVSATRDANVATNPIFVNLTDGTAVIGTTGNALDVNIASGAVIQQYDEDTVHVSGDTGNLSLVVRNDTLASLVSADGDYAPLQVNAIGALYVAVDGTVTIGDGGGSITVDGTVAATQSGVWDIGTVTTVTTVTSITNDVNIADGGNSITVDASQLDVDDLNLTDDAVRVSGNSSANTETNPIFVKNVETVLSGEEVHDYDTAAAVASDATSNHDYAVAGTTFMLTSVIVSGSGNIKFEIQTGPVASLATVAVGFLTGRQGDTKQINFSPAVEVPATSTGTIRVIRTNRQGSATDVYSTIIGNDV